MAANIAETFELLFDKNNNNVHTKPYKIYKKKVKKRIVFILIWIG